MNSIRNFFYSIYDRLFTVTITAALADLEKAEAKLRKAIEHHDAQAVVHDYAVEHHRAEAERHTYASIRADRVANKLADLIG